MSLTEQVNDIVEQAARLLSKRISLDGWQPPEVETLVQLEEAEAEEVERRYRALVDEYIADRSDSLACLRAIHLAAEAREAAYKAEAAPWLALARRQARLGEYVQRLARNILEAERTLAGFGPEDPYSVEQPNGTVIGLKRSPPAVQVDDVMAVPDEFMKPREPSKSEIAAALKAGREVPGARLVRGLSIRWK